MIKKHIITCTVIIALLVMAKVFAYHVPQASEELKVSTESYLSIEKEKAPASLMAQLSFATETLPLGDEKVEKKMKRILTSFNFNKVHSNVLHQKAAAWFPIIEPILKKYGIPNDFKYMPLVESGLKAGTSPKGAAGFWQFMPATARMYGLTVNGRADERNNLQKSTVAACKYLKELHKIFGNWALAAAAYNVGDGTITRQINKQNQDNYFKMRLNKETGGYVYKLISMKEIIVNPEKHGYEPPKTLYAYNAE